MIVVLQHNPSGRRAVAARKWLADNGPPDLQPLPLGYNEGSGSSTAAWITSLHGILGRSTAATMTCWRILLSSTMPAA